MNIQFGSGVLFGVPNAGNLAANPTPTRFGILQDCQVTFKGDLKKLYGQYQFASATARGKIDVTVKGKIATLDPNLLNQLYFGQTASTGLQRIIDGESHVPAATITPTNAVINSPLTDYGVLNGLTGLNMTKVSTSPAAGQYTFTQATSSTAAEYGFNAAETAPTVLLSYLYSDATHGVTLALANQLQGYAPIIQAFFYSNFRGKYFGLQLNACTMGQLSIPSKQEDFWISDFDMDANVDNSNNLGALFADTV